MWQISGPPATVAYLGNYIHIKISQDTNFNFNEKIANSLFGAPNCRPFGEIGGLPIGPKWTNSKIFQSYIVQNPNWKGDSLMKKIANSCIWGPILWAVLDILGGLPIGPQSTDLKNFELFYTQNPNSKGVRFMKKIANSCIWGPILRAIFKNGGSADQPRMDRFKIFQQFLTQNWN